MLNLQNKEESLETPLVTEIEPENAHHVGRQEWNKTFEESFTSTTSDTTCGTLLTAQQQNVYHRFPRVRAYTEDEFNRMLRGYGMKPTHANEHQNYS